MKFCVVGSCDGFAIAHGLCSRHYQAWRKYGDPNHVVLKQHHGKTLKERVEIYTQRGRGCWTWTGHKDPNGYGRLNVKNKPMLAHRLSYEVHVGPIPAGKVLCHRCDNPSCVNPAHLMVGEQADNVADMARKGRARKKGLKGSAHHQALLTEELVRTIRASDLSARELSESLGVSKTAIYEVRSRRTWKHI